LGALFPVQASEHLDAGDGVDSPGSGVLEKPGLVGVVDDVHDAELRVQELRRNETLPFSRVHSDRRGVDEDPALRDPLLQTVLAQDLARRVHCGLLPQLADERPQLVLDHAQHE
jgi:hypothetical protein